MNLFLNDLFWDTKNHCAEYNTRNNNLFIYTAKYLIENLGATNLPTLKDDTIYVNNKALLVDGPLHFADVNPFDNNLYFISLIDIFFNAIKLFIVLLI